jgi:hypothetical protein
MESLAIANPVLLSAFPSAIPFEMKLFKVRRTKIPIASGPIIPFLRMVQQDTPADSVLDRISKY